MTNAPRKPTILLAGLDPVLDELARRFERQGLGVCRCADGNLALQQAVEVKPNLLVIDAALAVIPAARLAQILRANPQGSELTVVFIGDEGEEIEGFIRHRDRFFPRPPNVSQIAAFVDNYFNRMERAKQFGRQQQEIEGSLDQLSLIDLLQIFGLNHKSGVLTLTRGVERGMISVDDGQIVNARLGRVEGEKAFYRLICWGTGSFRFTPGSVTGEAKLTAPTDHLIMEGLRLNDETVAQAESLPTLNARLALRIPRENLPQGLRPATREILLKLEYYPKVSDLLDHCPYPDLQVLQILRVLREKGVISETRDADLPNAAPLLAADEILTVHQALFGAGRLVDQAQALLVVLCATVVEQQNFMRMLDGVPEFVVTGQPQGEPLAPVELGRLQLSESFSLRLVSVPASPAMAPLWSLYRRHLFGVLSLGPYGAFAEAEGYFASKQRTLAYLDKCAPDGQFFDVKKDGRKAIGSMLTRFAARFHDPMTPAEVS